MEILFRNATCEDFESVYPLFEQLWPNKTLNKAELNKVFSRGVSSQTDELLCAVLDGAIIGFCAYAIVNNLWQEGYISYIYAMVVDEKQRGKGFGTVLLDEAINKSKNQGMKRVELDSGFQREQAHEFYQKFGFEKRAYLFSYEF
ncbi:aminoalkylphosphonic acid N-acetyltransferase [compost metagenome]|uniref:GNAT family N-acetyltransferase n=1 Tax=Paenibacillus TaxID=44249 RepID=UPI000F97889A|nr:MULTISPECIES: GNAT family N-acetyltransferase [Paenibacillus]MBY9077115.1 GNAT family N-acetyltransferase [Paenibacillus sp. CGMCC 1.18879]MBY9084700.1 GNAT family N-acetyltransferase [Paenibacillus sinensis]